ncbi:hypothetical protein UFOVP29_10 [uncultured Caudovirales phage]|uniref:Uncharacterized protein n=1 Tax=uncultured Caudovirales phage TaxID=2100421 RepID=A0A6J5KJP7_9CAUD|nr:hypothetical protein UFOVP29_10 [uncultured Caudovirales phage]
MTKLITKTCAFCTNPFTVPTKAASQLYCNKSCYLKGVDQRRVRSHCLVCNDEIVSHTARRFCSKSHAAQFNNTQRDQDSRSKQRQSLLATLAVKPKNPSKTTKPTQAPSNAITRQPRKVRGSKQSSSKLYKTQIEGPYTTVYRLICAHSGEAFYARHRRKYSPKYQHLYSRDGKALYKFTFNIYKYPDLFDLSLISQHGWYSVGGKSLKPLNKLGCSRDHKVSITDAIINNYDPHYIKHPLNCELMLHVDNKIKHSKSSLDYSDLVRMVDEYEHNGGRGGIRTLGTPIRSSAV